MDLDQYFDYQIVGEEVRIHNIRTDYPKDEASRYYLTQALFDCEPHYVVMPGWQTAQPSTVQRFVESAQNMLKAPVAILSFGPTWRDKFIINTEAISCPTGTAFYLPASFSFLARQSKKKKVS